MLLGIRIAHLWYMKDTTEATSLIAEFLPKGTRCAGSTWNEIRFRYTDTETDSTYTVYVKSSYYGTFDVSVKGGKGKQHEKRRAIRRLFYYTLVTRIYGCEPEFILKDPPKDYDD
jgi:hypothetical protein